MRRSKFSDNEIAKILAEVEGGQKPNTVCQVYGISVQTFYRWKALFDNKNGLNAARLRNLELDNHRLKQTVADLSLDIRTLKVALSKSPH
jgi:putative transposase